MSSGRERESGIAWGRWQRIAGLCAVVAAIVFVGLCFTPLAGPHPLTQAGTSYLVAFSFWLELPLGCLVVLMIHYLSGGAWGVLLRPVLESAAGTLPLLLLMFIPVIAAMCLGAASPYPWARPLEQVATGSVLEELQEKTALLNPLFVAIRGVVYFLIWLILAFLLRHWSRQWRSGNEWAGRRLPNLSGPGLVIYGITITFAAIDWIMSLEPFWHSTMYPPIYAIGQIVSGFAFATIALQVLSRRPPLAGRVRRLHRRDLGGLLLTFIIFWSYFVFSQFMLMWVGNLSDEVPYYLKRLRGGWEWIGIALIVFHFAAPFLLLLMRDVKENGAALLGVALGVLVIRFVDVLWWIEPAFPHEGWLPYWLLDVAAAVALGGAWAACFLGNLKRMSLEPVHAPEQCEPEAANES